MRRISRKVRVFALVVLALAIPIAWLTPAGASSFTSSVTITYKPKVHIFKGTVTSPQPSCIPSRAVHLYRIRPNQTPKRQLVGSTTTNSTGRWRVSEANAHGKYRVIVDPKQVAGYQTTDTCLRATKKIVV